MILARRFYMVLILIILLMGSGYAFAPLFTIGQGLLFVLLLLVLADGYMLYRIRGIRAFRQCSARFSNGDENAVNLRVESSYPYPVFAEVIDEVPFIFQQRNISFWVQHQIRRIHFNILLLSACITPGEQTYPTGYEYANLSETINSPACRT